MNPSNDFIEWACQTAIESQVQTEEIQLKSIIGVSSLDYKNLYKESKHEVFWNCMEWVNKKDNSVSIDIGANKISIEDGIKSHEIHYDSSYIPFIGALEEAIMYYHNEFVK